MTGLGPRSVLVVAEEPVEVDTLEQPGNVSVTVLTEPTGVFEELTHSVYDCLVLPGTIDGQPGVDLAYGIATLFPDLPIVISGTDRDAVTPPAHATVVESASLLDDAVTEAVVDQLGGDRPAVAGRPPSPMETLLLSLFEEMPHHLYAKDDAARHVLMGRGFNEPTDRIGLTDVEVAELQDDHGEAALQDELDLIEGRTDRIEVEEFLDLSAEYVETVKIPWYSGEGDIRGIAGLTQDSTEQKRREHAFQRQHERMVKTALVAAHEYRNELQIALGRLELLDCEQAQFERIEESLARLEAITDTVVNLAQTQPTVDDQQPVWLSRLSRELWDTLTDGKASLEIEDDARVVADQESASLLLQNLFQNALDHAGPDVTITVGATEDGFFVADDGPGIDASPPERIFDVGFTTIERNTGFGLYVVQMVADNHDWTVSLSESATGGARFDIGNVDLQ
jgi:signal transduction histidine kinase